MKRHEDKSEEVNFPFKITLCESSPQPIECSSQMLMYFISDVSKVHQHDQSDMHHL